MQTCVTLANCNYTNVEFTVNTKTSSNGNIFCVTGPLCGEFTGPGEFSAQRPVTRSFDGFFDLRLNKRLSKWSWGWWYGTPPWSLWRQCNEFGTFQIKVCIWHQLHKEPLRGIFSSRRWENIPLILSEVLHVMWSLFFPYHIGRGHVYVYPTCYMTQYDLSD